MINSFKVGGVVNSSSESAAVNAPPQNTDAGALAESQLKKGGAATPAGKPARQLELEAQGRNARAKIERHQSAGGDATQQPNKSGAHQSENSAHESKTQAGQSQGDDPSVDLQSQTHSAPGKSQDVNPSSNAHGGNGRARQAQSEGGGPRESSAENSPSFKAQSGDVTAAETQTDNQKFNNSTTNVEEPAGLFDSAPRSDGKKGAGEGKGVSEAKAGGDNQQLADGETPGRPDSGTSSVTTSVEAEGEGQNYVRPGVDAGPGDVNSQDGPTPGDGEGQKSSYSNTETKHSGGREQQQVNTSADSGNNLVKAETPAHAKGNGEVTGEPGGQEGYEQAPSKSDAKPHETHTGRQAALDSPEAPETRRAPDGGPPIEKRAEPAPQSRPTTAADHATLPDADGGMPTETRTALKQELGSIGHEAARTFVERNDELANRYIDTLASRADNSLARGTDQGRTPAEIARRMVDEVVDAARLNEHFARLEKVGGEPVRRAQEAVMRLMSQVHDPNGRGAENGHLRSDFSAAELLRDLTSGALLQLRDVNNPFPLTGRARVVSEMIELLRTLDAIEMFWGKAGTLPQPAVNSHLLAALTGAALDAEIAAEIARLLQQGAPALPGSAGRNEIPLFVATLGGTSADGQGEPWLTAEGEPLKFGGLMWLDSLGGTVTSLHRAGEHSSAFSPSPIYGFDALYSLVGFDGRSLTPPRFVMIQSQMNASEFEWVFGQAPLSEGWMRAVIERLKDSVSTDYNAFGEMLEEALADGRLYAAVLSGEVEEGRPVPDSFSLRPAYNFGHPAGAPAT